jgi:hypothetical protein
VTCVPCARGAGCLRARSCADCGQGREPAPAAPPRSACALTRAGGGRQELDRWEERLEELFEGRPYDEYDAALTESISRFPVDIQPFRDMARPCGAAGGRC